MNPYASTGSVSTVTASVSGASGGGVPGEHRPVARSLSTAQVLGRLVPYVRPRAGLLAGAFAASAVSIGLQLFVPVLIGYGIDCIVGAGRVDFARLAPLLIQLALVVAAASALQWLQGALIARLTYATVRDLRIDADAKLFGVPVSYIDTHARGDLISRVVNDIDQVGDGLLQGVTQLFGGIVTIVGTLAFMLASSVPMALVVILVTPLSLGAASAIARLSSKSFTAQQRVQGELGGYIEEYVGAQGLVSTFAYADRAHEGFDRLNRALYTCGERAQFLSSLSNPGTRFVNNLIYAVVAAVGCAGVITGVPAPLTVGGVQLFLSYANQYTKPFNEVTSVVAQIQTAFASARRVFALLDAVDEAPDAPGALTATSGAGEIEFRSVAFSYVPSRPLLRDISFRARPGMRVALVGPTGCGKTTLISLLLRLYDIQVGQILVDGHEVSAYTRSGLRRAFGMVLQESWLFEGTVHDNIAYGRPDATRAQVEQAARRARADAFIRALPDGYDTVLPEGAGSLSQGQRQLICIARVMLTDPEILLLDEATSSIDTRTELQVQAAFDELMSGRTSIVVAHRLSTIANADCILVMDDGRIVERGTHDELLAADGAYAELYRSQFAASEA